MTLSKALDEEPLLVEFIAQNDDADEIMEMAFKLEGLATEDKRQFYNQSYRDNNSNRQILSKAFPHAGDIDILVSTTVIEVGVDVPNSTVMMIENANRFGLAQLHQLRGRVGRGQHKSYCLLVAGDASGDTEERLKALEQTNDGFELAEKDLELRGPGEFFGRRQSGLPEMQLASFTDKGMFEAARQEAEKIFNDDPGLKRPEHKPLHDRVTRFWENAGDIS